MFYINALPECPRAVRKLGYAALKEPVNQNSGSGFPNQFQIKTD
jgi:hypothetical protein